MSAQERTAQAMTKVADIMERIARKMGVELPAAAEAGPAHQRRLRAGGPVCAATWDDWGEPPDLTFQYSYEQEGEGPPGSGMASGGVSMPRRLGGKGSDIVRHADAGRTVLTVGQNYDYERRRQQEPARAGAGGHHHPRDGPWAEEGGETEVAPLLVSAYRRNVNGFAPTAKGTGE